jgi:apolipoprotein N-acyltransferase
MIRSTNTGVSVLLSRSGKIEAESTLFKEEILNWRLKVPANAEEAALVPTTIYARYGDIFSYLCGIVGLAGIFVVNILSRRAKK